MQLNEGQQASQDQFQRQSGNYGKSHILADTSDIESLLAGVDLPATGKALDVATGGGHAALFFARKGWDVTASDLTRAMLDNTEKLIIESGYTVKTALHPAEQLPYPDGSFDLVSCRVAAHHFTDNPSFVSEVHRVLKDGGYFILIDGSVQDGAPEAEEWIHQIEKLRDPSHGRFVSPGHWRKLCESVGLEVLVCNTHPFKQPDLEWYFNTAATTPENRAAVLKLITEAPASARSVFKLAEEDGKIVWWWPRLGLLARK